MSDLILSIDLDEWYHCRWATGSVNSRWKSVPVFFEDYYQTNTPIGEIIQPTHEILDMLKTQHVKATFFILGEVAEFYPELVKKIAQEGHEIACHGMHHVEPSLLSQKEFSEHLAQSKQILEYYSQQPIIGFRSPNLVITDWLQDVLINQQFQYDSSICPSRKLFGKYSNQSHVPNNPYQTAHHSLLEQGESSFWEIPIPVLPVLKLPGAVSISTRIFGWQWTQVTLDHALKSGTACYYMHPYEFNKPPKLFHPTLFERIFLRRSGKYMFKILNKLLKQYQGRIITAKQYISNNSR